MRSLLKKLVPATADIHWGSPQIRWRVTSFLVLALMFGLSHLTYAATVCVSTASELQTALTTAAFNGQDDRCEPWCRLRRVDSGSRTPSRGVIGVESLRRTIP